LVVMSENGLKMSKDEERMTFNDISELTIVAGSFQKV
jgi:hypothetical protein